MNIAAMTFRLRASWVHSLKEKRMIVKSLTAQLQNKFHVSAAEIDEQDTHQTIVIGVGGHRSAQCDGGQPDGGDIPVCGRKLRGGDSGGDTGN